MNGPASASAAAGRDTPTLHLSQANGLALAHAEWRPARRGQGPGLWLVHATGFHGRVWDQVLHHLPGVHAIAVDQRGHGRSAPAPDGRVAVPAFSDWAPFGADQAALLDHLGLAAGDGAGGLVGVGHSMGAHALVQAAVLRPRAFARLVLVDPVIMAPEQYTGAPTPPGTLHPAAQRKARFASPEAMVQRFAGRPPYAVFQREALVDYCVHGLKPVAEPGAADGEAWELACAPAFEAQVYPMARNNPGTHALLQALRVPVLVVRARPGDPAVKPWDPLGSPTWPGLAASLAQGRDLPLACTHFLPMEDPAQMAALLREELAAAAG